MKSNKDRKNLLKLYGRFYKKLKNKECFYCGDVVTEMDHCPPLSWVEYKELIEWKKMKIKFLLVGSCNECNNLLSNKPYFSLYERCSYINKILEEKFDKFNGFWSNDEVNELGDNLSSYIKAKQQFVYNLNNRVIFSQNKLVKFPYELQE